MASILLIALLCTHTLSSPISNASMRAHGVCSDVKIPVSVVSDSAIYEYPKVDNDVDAIAWAIYSDTWSTPAGNQRLTRNTTLSDTFKIHALLCIPNDNSKSILQIATHGVHYDSRYWDPELDRENLSYIEAAHRAGYMTLAYDRLGVGQSDIPDAYDVVQSPVKVGILEELTIMTRDGKVPGLLKPCKIVHIGHSFGSVLTSAFVAKHGGLSDGAIITGYIFNKYLGKSGMAAFNAEFSENRPNGYIVRKKSGIQTIFFAGNKDAYTQEMLDYGDLIKQPVPIGEFASAYHIIDLPGLSFKGPIQYMLAEFDFYICGGDCKGIASMDALRKTYPSAATINVAIQPNTGHAFTLHNGFSRSKWIVNGLGVARVEFHKLIVCLQIHIDDMFN